MQNEDSGTKSLLKTQGQKIFNDTCTLESFLYEVHNLLCGTCGMESTVSNQKHLKTGSSAHFAAEDWEQKLNIMHTRLSRYSCIFL